MSDDDFVSAEEDVARISKDGVTAVDMETAAVAAVCDRRGTPWSVFRVISDMAGDSRRLSAGDGQPRRVGERPRRAPLSPAPPVADLPASPGWAATPRRRRTWPPTPRLRPAHRWKADGVTTGEIVVTSPYDGAELGRVPECGQAEVDQAVAAAATPSTRVRCPAWQRAEILDRAARLLDERTEDFARIIAAEAAKPLKTARIEAQRAVSTFTFAAVAARTLAGDLVPMDASDAGEGKLAFTLRVPIGVVGGDQPVQLPAQPRRAQGRARDRGRLPGRAEAGVADAAVGDRPRASSSSTSAGCPPAPRTS